MPFLSEWVDCTWNLRCPFKLLLHHLVNSCIPDLVFPPVALSLEAQTRSGHPAPDASLTALCLPRWAESTAETQTASSAALIVHLPQECPVLSNDWWMSQWMSERITSSDMHICHQLYWGIIYISFVEVLFTCDKIYQHIHSCVHNHSPDKEHFYHCKSCLVPLAISFLYSQPLRSLFCISVSVVLLFLEFQTNGIIQYVVFCVCLI